MVTIEDILDAREKIRPYVKETSLYYSNFFSDFCKGKVYFKLENEQITNSFKIRGATNKILNLSEEEKERMVKDAEKFAEQDKKQREEAEVRNNADSLIYTAEKTKKDLAEKLTEDQKERVDKSISNLKDALSGSDIEEMKAKSEELTNLLQEVGTAIYQQSSAKQATQEANKSKSSKKESNEKVVDSKDYKVDED